MRRAFWFIRKILKFCICRLRVMVIIEYCDTCGRRQPLVWWATDDLWDRLVPNGGVQCPKCFHELARKAGIALVWVPTVEYEPAQSPAAAPTGKEK